MCGSYRTRALCAHAKAAVTTFPTKSMVCLNGDRLSTETRFISLIHASKTITQLHQIHAQILCRGLFSHSRIVTQLISSSSLHKSIDYALLIFRHFCERNLFVFNALIRALVENMRYESSVSHFVDMLKLTIRPDRLTYPFILKSAAALLDTNIGKVVHGGVLKSGFEFDSFVRVSLVDMYVKVDELVSALQVFEESSEKNKSESILLWNVLINGCCKIGDLNKAIELFNAMPERNSGSWNSLINGYAKSGNLDQGLELFDRMPDKNVVSWTTMISGFSQNGDHKKALWMFFIMLKEGVKPNDLTFVSVLSSCVKIGALETGVWVHNYVSSNGFRLNKALGNALIDMYAKCGDLDAACRVFKKLKTKDLLSWSIMIWGSAIHGCYAQALQYFDQMKSAGINPDEVVFLAVLTACSHSGQTDTGLEIFHSIKRDYSMEPNMKHYALVVDMFGRAGRLEEALSFIDTMPITSDFVVWGALFHACRVHKNIKMAEIAHEKLLQLEPRHTGGHVLMSNIYPGVGRWNEVENVISLMKCRSVAKDPGWSFIEVHGHVHNFVAGDHNHERAEEINLKLDEMTKSARAHGYMPETEWVLHNIEDKEKEDSVGSHSEKLALAFGLITTNPGTTIRIFKNLWVCGDCHSIMKHASKLSQREIIMRDVKRFHHFKDGVCSCGDYW